MIYKIKSQEKDLTAPVSVSLTFSVSSTRVSSPVSVSLSDFASSLLKDCVVAETPSGEKQL